MFVIVLILEIFSSFSGERQLGRITKTEEREVVVSRSSVRQVVLLLAPGSF